MFDLGGQRSKNEICVELTCEAVYKIWWRYLYWFKSYFNCSHNSYRQNVKFWPFDKMFDLGGQRSENEKCVELTCEAAYKIWWRYLYWFYSYFNCSPNVKKRSSFDLLTESLTLEVKGQKMKYVWNWPVKLYIKFGEDISIGSKVISIVLLISYRRTDRRTDGQSES